jgi:hypothetical protein
MDPKDMEHERRKQRRLERLGCQNPVCATCGETRWQCLELHHVVDCDGKSATVILCSNCHRLVTIGQKNHPPHGEVGDPFLESVGRFLLGLAELLKLAVEQLVAFGEALIQRASAEAA